MISPDQPLKASSQSKGSSVRGFLSLEGLADRLGICLSALCVIHCLAMPLAIALVPALQLSFSHDVFHLLLIVILPALALLAFVPGYRKHRDLRAFLWALPGVVLIVVGAGFEEDYVMQALFSVPGSLCLIRAHWLNRHLCACCRSHHGRHANSLAETPSDI